MKWKMRLTIFESLIHKTEKLLLQVKFLSWMQSMMIRLLKWHLDSVNTEWKRRSKRNCKKTLKNQSIKLKHLKAIFRKFEHKKRIWVRKSKSQLRNMKNGNKKEQKNCWNWRNRIWLKLKWFRIWNERRKRQNKLWNRKTKIWLSWLSDKKQKTRRNKKNLNKLKQRSQL